MNLFRSEEHAKAWSKYSPDSTERTMPVAKYARHFGTDYQRLRLDPDYFVNRMELQKKRDAQRAAIEND
ncbi:MAG: hypothetical protein IH960_00205 [Chloroflexi bacterium]|jgi:hypothetical protein|nr:hypothetical protein [Chloroflexota bacterium]MCH7982838.1 hypothetical protein [Chloroflexota bacterium]MCH8228986.1 hypothetical protein [Chloroflexota bacterium]MCH8909145.1 hypothetical protein [Chloroflexota bacterium]MCI0808224.1 hypothetical protein [Chloroflexota bacterium]